MDVTISLWEFMLAAVLPIGSILFGIIWFFGKRVAKVDATLDRDADQIKDLKHQTHDLRQQIRSLETQAAALHQQVADLAQKP